MTARWCGSSWSALLPSSPSLPSSLPALPKPVLFSTVIHFCVLHCILFADLRSFLAFISPHFCSLLKEPGLWWDRNSGLQDWNPV